MSKNILITGGAGFIGSKLALKLLDSGHNITVLDNLSSQVHGKDPSTTSSLYRTIKDKVRFIKGSVTNSRDWLAAVPGQNIILHFAAETGTGQSMYEIGRYTDVNIKGTAILLDILTNNSHTVEKLIIASSRAVYGEGKYLSDEMGIVYPNPRQKDHMFKGDFEVKYPGCFLPLKVMATDEESKIHPSSIYGITKQVQEQMVMTVANSIGIDGITFRYQNVYGPGQSLSNPYTGILSIFSSRIRNRKSITIFEDGKESRDFIFIDDAVNATILGIEKDEANGHIFNVGTGIPINVITVVDELKKSLGIEVPAYISGNFRLGDIRHNFADISKISSVLGFKPEICFSEGVSHFSRWVYEQVSNVDEYDRSLLELRQKGILK